MIQFMDELPRRDFVALAAVAPAVAAESNFFSPADEKWIDALMAQIIPTDDAPGAREAGCLAYLDRQLQSALSRFAADYRNGLKSFQRAHPKFLELNFAEQTAVLEGMPRNAFFEMLVDHTMQGFYGSPEHGGNRGEVSWKMMGIDKYMGGGHWHGA
jgi:gluconate 2-dehydrogenase gamma chain